MSLSIISLSACVAHSPASGQLQQLKEQTASLRQTLHRTRCPQDGVQSDSCGGQQSLAASADEQAGKQGFLQRSAWAASASWRTVRKLTRNCYCCAFVGTGVLPGLGPKAQGRHPRSKAPYIKDPAKMRYFVAPEGWLDASGQLASLHTSPVRPISILLGQDCTTFQTDTLSLRHWHSSNHTSSKHQARMLRYHKTGRFTTNSRRIWTLKAGASESTKASLALVRRMPTAIATASMETTTCSLGLLYEAGLRDSHASQSFPSGNPSLRYPITQSAV